MTSYATPRRGLYRSRRGLILGVCRGIAEYLDIPVFGVRLLAILAFVFTGFFPLIVIYPVAALLMRPEPLAAPGQFAGLEYRAPSRPVRPLRETRETLERRIQRLESAVTSKDFAWEQRLSK